MKKLFLIAMIAASTLLTACGTVETGNVGVRKTFGQVQQDEVQPGFYQSILSSVDEYTTKETYVSLQNLTPKAKDKLILKDLDVTVYYKTNPQKVAEFVSTHAAMSAKMQGEGFIRPGYVLIENMARGIVSDEVSGFDSLTLHQNRTDLEVAIKNALTEQLNKSDPGYFEITRVVVSSLLTDPSVEESIRKNIAMTNEIDTAKKEVQKKLEEANAMMKTANALTPMLLQHEYIKAIDKCAANPDCTLFVGAPGNLNMTLPK
jgi:regulator of protease activity HflC (stomatin/prohibitin superfamily)